MLGGFKRTGLLLYFEVLSLMKRLFLTLLLLIALPVLASHIVGGEFELVHLSGNSYQLNMILYFDLINGAPLAKDLSVTATIYRKRDNAKMRDVTLDRVSEEPVSYTQPACSHGELQTNKITYSAGVTLTPALYNDPKGYYVSWQRCCRNYTITNIFSNDPNAGFGIAAGQTFYLEFPPVIKDGQPFYNSSPRLFPPLNDYACPFRPYYVNFAGVDDDGDSLVYTMTTPLNTTEETALPPASPGPYPLVTWRNPFSLLNIIAGKPDLRISHDGFLTCTPTLQGLFVFAVRVEQFRNHEKIGESRRDFQMLVTDGCSPDEPPKILGKKLAETNFTYNKNMTVFFSRNIPDDQRCIQVRVSDADSQSPASNFTENISLKVIPLNFSSKSLSRILPSEVTATLTNGSTKDFSICFPECPLANGGTFRIGIIAFDDACSLPRSDTLDVEVTVEPPPNTPPHFITPVTSTVSGVLNEAGSDSWSFKVVDDELDSLSMVVLTDGFVLKDAGMTVTIEEHQKGVITGTIHWEAFCNIYDFTKRTKFKVSLYVDDRDRCNSDNPTIEVYNFTVILPGVANVNIDTDLTADPLEQFVGLTRKVNESLSFNVTATQADGDQMRLVAIGKNFKLSDYGMSFEDLLGNEKVTSHFQWDIGCANSNLAVKDFFDIRFIATDISDKCHRNKGDTVEVTIKVLPPDDPMPQLTMVSLNDISLVNGNATIVVGQSVAINLLGSENTSTVQDNLMLKLIDVTGTTEATGYTFESAQGLGNVQSPFLWKPECKIFENGILSNDYTFRFSLADDRCYTSKGDTLILHLTVKDIVQRTTVFTPYNVITPNGDNCNDYFAVEGLDDDPTSAGTCVRNGNTDAQISFPLDDCNGHFQRVRIFNRWGKEVFSSGDRKFRWYAQNQDQGVYYFQIEYGNQTFKGPISVNP
jgi:CHU_C Type IX secretion signal domain